MEWHSSEGNCTSQLNLDFFGNFAGPADRSSVLEDDSTCCLVGFTVFATSVNWAGFFLIWGVLFWTGLAAPEGSAALYRVL